MALDLRQGALELMASMRASMDHAGEMEGALCKVLGLPPNTMPQILSMKPEAEHVAALAWKVPDGRSDKRRSCRSKAHWPRGKAGGRHRGLSEKPASESLNRHAQLPRRSDLSSG